MWKPPPFDEHLGLEQRVKRFPFQQFVWKQFKRSSRWCHSPSGEPGSLNKVFTPTRPSHSRTHLAVNYRESRCVFLLLTQHLACGRSRQSSCDHAQEQFLSAQLRVAAMKRLEKLATHPFGHPDAASRNARVEFGIGQ